METTFHNIDDKKYSLIRQIQGLEKQKCIINLLALEISIIIIVCPQNQGSEEEMYVIRRTIGNNR